MAIPFQDDVSSPHLIRHYNATQLSLVAHDRRCAVLAVSGERYAGTAVLVHLPTLRSRLDWLQPDVEDVVIVDELLPDAATVGKIDDMLAAFAEMSVDVLSQWVPATEALKQDEGGIIQGAVDREDVVSLRAPTVFRRERLADAITRCDDAVWVDPAAVVARAGGSVALFDHSMLPTWLQTR